MLMTRRISVSFLGPFFCVVVPLGSSVTLPVGAGEESGRRESGQLEFCLQLCRWPLWSIISNR